LKLNELQNGRDLAKYLNVKYDKDLMFWLYAVEDDSKYYSFNIPKRSGGVRKIRSPDKNLKLMQKKVANALQEIYRPKHYVHGFVRGQQRNTATNAAPHVGKRWVLNVDIQNFFESIHFGRIKGRLRQKPYNFTEEMARLIAHMACYDRVLATGAPTSPVLANMVVDRLDSELHRLSRQHHCRYSRYADDVSISTNNQFFPEKLAFLKDADNLDIVEAGQALSDCFEKNGFLINQYKLRLQRSLVHQEVTGLVVNEKLNVPRKFYRQIRAMLNAWEKYGYDKAAEEHFKKYRKDRGEIEEFSAKNFAWIVRGKISYVGRIRGRSDFLFRKLANRYNAQDPISPIVIPEENIEQLISNSVWVLESEEVLKKKDKNGKEISDVLYKQGTAFLLRDIGLLSCYHCCGDNMRITHPENPDLSIDVAVDKYDKDIDICLLRIVFPGHKAEIKNRGIFPGNIHDFNEIKIGSNLKLAGYPKYSRGETVSIVAGDVVSKFDMAPLHYVEKYRWNFSSPIIDGMSGCPIINKHGRVVGVGVEGPGEADAIHPSRFVPLRDVLNSDSLA